MPLALREYSASWAATAAKAVKTKPTKAIEPPNAHAPAGGSFALIESAWIRPINTDAPPATTTAAVSAAYRPTTPALNSSARPVSSSARVWRVTVKTAISPIIRARKPTMRQAMKPPAVVKSNAGPYSSANDGFAAAPAASAAFASAVG